MEFLKLTKALLMVLSKVNQSPLVSIYVPIFDWDLSGEYADKSLKSLVLRAEEKLAGHYNLSGTKVRDMLSCVEDFKGQLKASKDLGAKGLAFLLGDQKPYIIHLDDPVSASVLVDDHFELRPLVRELEHNSPLAVVVAGLNGLRYFTGALPKLEEVKLPEALRSSFRDFSNGFEFSPKLAYHATGRKSSGMMVEKWSGDVAKDKKGRYKEEYFADLSKNFASFVTDQAPELLVSFGPSTWQKELKGCTKNKVLVLEGLKVRDSSPVSAIKKAVEPIWESYLAKRSDLLPDLAPDVWDAYDALKEAQAGNLKSLVLAEDKSIGEFPELLSLVAARAIARGSDITVRKSDDLKDGALLRGYLRYQ